MTKSGGNTFRGSVFEHYAGSCASVEQRVVKRLVIDPATQNSAYDHPGRRPDLQPQRIRRDARRSDLTGPAVLLRLAVSALREADTQLPDQQRSCRRRRCRVTGPTMSSSGRSRTTGAPELQLNCRASGHPIRPTAAILGYDGARANESTPDRSQPRLSGKPSATRFRSGTWPTQPTTR